MRVLVCGGRDFKDNEMLSEWLDTFDISFLIEGGAKGADMLARFYAYDRGIPVETFVAQWEKYGKSAGPIRNQKMIDDGKPDLVIAFPGGNGTADMVSRAKKAGINVFEIGDRINGCQASQ